jgi:hypothetical protein
MREHYDIIWRIVPIVWLHPMRWEDMGDRSGVQMIPDPGYREPLTRESYDG